MEKLNENEISKLAEAAKDGKLIIEIINREGKAPVILDPVKPLEPSQLLMAGAIGTIHEFLKKRSHLYRPEECHIEVNAENLLIQFIGNECQKNNEEITKVFSNIQKSDDYEKLIVNDEIELSSDELAKYIRRRKHLFGNVDLYLKIWGALSSFQSEVNKQIENSDDRTGNMVKMIKQKVTSNVPKVFQLYLKPFKNIDAGFEFEVEIEINPNNLACSLVSFDLDLKVEALAHDLLMSELNSEISEGLAVKDFCVVYFS